MNFVKWLKNLTPWSLFIDGDKIYGRGTADNKGQHSINIGALSAILKTRGNLGFNSKIIIDYAHTPDALLSVLQYANSLSKNIMESHNGKIYFKSENNKTEFILSFTNN